MKKKSKLLVSFIVIIIGILSGCNETMSNHEVNRFVGSWKAENDFLITFYSNGTCDPDVLGQKYEINDEKLVFIQEAYDTEVNITYEYSFSSDYTILYLKLVGGDGTITVFRKQ